MKLVVAVRLFPGAAQEAALRDTLTLCNRAANMVSAQAFEDRVTAKQPLQRLTYRDLKQMGLSAQPAIHVARKVAGAYAALKANIRAGNLGGPGSDRRVKAGSRPIRFRPDAAQPFDDRCLSWQMDLRTVFDLDCRRASGRDTVPLLPGPTRPAPCVPSGRVGPGAPGRQMVPVRDLRRPRP